MSMTTLYTVGHGTRSLEELCAILREARIEVLVDARVFARSSRQPQYDREPLKAAVENIGVSYRWAGDELGGRRPAREESPHVALAADGLRGYADHMDSEVFRAGAQAVMELASRARVAVLSAEPAPEHCHRWLLADYLTVQGARVLHLLRPGAEPIEHRLSPQLRVEEGRLIYDRITGEIPTPG